jgi:hypothetical protein
MGKIAFNLVKVLKSDHANSFKAYFELSPWLATMATLSNPNSLTSNASSNIANYDIYQNYLVY